MHILFDLQTMQTIPFKMIINIKHRIITNESYFDIIGCLMIEALGHKLGPACGWTLALTSSAKG
jgi:hypothetical protein